MPRPLTLAEHTLLAELIEKSLDAMFDDQFPENGSFSRRTITGRDGEKRPYFYYQGYRPNASKEEEKRYQKYVGPADDPAIAKRVENFKDIKSGRKQRSSLVKTLNTIGLAKPPVHIGRIVEALAKAGVFRMRAVLIGSVAYQTYPAVLGMKLDDTFSVTGDVDIAQFQSISLSIEDQSEPIIDVLRDVDPTFRAVPHPSNPITSTAFENAAHFRLELLTPNRGSDDHQGKALRMPSLAGASADPLRFLDFLIHQPVRSVLLYGAGVSVNVPAPERFAIHKLIISQRRLKDPVGIAKSRKDIAQAGELIQALAQSGNSDALALVYAEAYERGPQWRSLLAGGIERLSVAEQTILDRLQLPK